MSTENRTEIFELEESNIPPTYVQEDCYFNGEQIRSEQIARFKYPLDAMLFMTWMEKIFNGTDENGVKHEFLIYMDNGEAYEWNEELIECLTSMVNKIGG